MKVAPVSADLLLKIGLVVGALVLLGFAVKKVSSLAGDMAGNAASLADQTAANVIVGLGGVAGIPATDLDQCELDLARGDTWAASFSCPASRFIKGVVNPPANVGVTGSWG